MKEQLKLSAFLLLLSFVSTTWLFWSYERENNASILTFIDVVWWWMVSSTTVGYGDIAPVTWQGRLAGVLTIIIGIYCYTTFIAMTSDSLHELMNRRRFGTARLYCRDHIIICEYTAFADELIQVLHHYPDLANREVVVVTDLVQINPYPQHHFVRGVPISPTALQQANIEEAAYIFVFANVRFQEPDLKTLHTVSRIQKLNQQAEIYVEMHNPNSEFTQHLNGPIHVLHSRTLLESILRHETLDLSTFFVKTDCSAVYPDALEALS